MNVLIINPNINTELTASVLTAAQAKFSGRMNLMAVTASRGVSVVASRTSYAVAAQSALECWSAWSQAVDAIVVACFGDPGVAALRELTQVPVYGLAQSTLRAANVDARGYKIVTAGSAWSSMLDELVLTWDLGANYRGTHTINATGLDAIQRPRWFRAQLQEAIEKISATDVGTIVLGGAALVGAADKYASPIRVLDCLQSTLDEVWRMRTAPATSREPLPKIISRGLDPNLARLLAGD